MSVQPPSPAKGNHTLSMLRAVGAGQVAWKQVGPWLAYGFCHADGRKYAPAHYSTLITLHQLRKDLLIEVCFHSGRVTLTDAGRAYLAVKR